MIYYRVCYFILNPIDNTWETVKEYPLSEAVAWTRVDYLVRSTPSLIWLEEVAPRGICVDCEALLLGRRTKSKLLWNAWNFCSR